jgi:multidrug resistance efflux pump
VTVGFVFPFQRLLETSSVEAVVKVPTITLRAPIDGEVEASANPVDFGASVGRGDVLFRIASRRADRSRVDDLTRQIEQLRDERPGVAARLETARALLNDLTEQTRLFAEARILQLEARQDEFKAEVAAALARNEEAKTSLGRFTTLAGKGWMPTAQLNQAQRDGSVAEMLAAAARKRLEAVGVELAAARRGVFVGIGNNDRPRYMQRVDQLEQQVGSLAETLVERDKRLLRLAGVLTEERARYAVLSEANIIAPATGSVSEVLVTPGEQVQRGQDLLRVTDCGRAIVAAVIKEGVYNRLQVGSPVRFQPRDTRDVHLGRVVGVAAHSSAPAGPAVRLSGHASDSYQVTIAIPKLTNGQSCMAGRTGRVYFDGGAVEVAAVAAVDRL